MDINSILSFLAPFIQSFAQSHPVILSVIAAVGVCRLIFKALFTFLHSIADATPSDWDNKLIDDAEKSGVYKAVMFILDYVFSIKINK